MLSPAHRLYLLFTPALAGEKPWRTLEAALKGGVDLVQWRSKESDDAGFRACRDVCMARGVPILVNDDVMLGVRGRAHGAHVGQDDMPHEVARKLLVNQWLGVSTHNREQITAAVAAGADYVGFGPCYPTATKGYDEGPARRRDRRSGVRVPRAAVRHRRHRRDQPAATARLRRAPHRSVERDPEGPGSLRSSGTFARDAVSD